MYFNKKKIALHRILYNNYVEEIHDNEYIKFICSNKGRCCNINHMKKFIYNKNINEDLTDTDIKQETKNNTQKNNKLTIEF